MRNLYRFSFLTLFLSVILFAGSWFFIRQTRDVTRPEIKMDTEEITISVKDDVRTVLEGIRATDNKDGDITEQLVLESLGHFFQDKKRTAVIFASDKAGNASKASRTVYYSDYESPVVSLSGPLMISYTDVEKLENRIHISDSLDGSLNDEMTLSSNRPISETTPGDYELTIHAVNTAGDVVSVTATLTCFAPTEYAASPQIGLSDYLVYLDQGADFDAQKYIEGLMLYGEHYSFERENRVFRSDAAGLDATEENKGLIPLDKMIISGNVDTQVPGNYEVTYQLNGYGQYEGVVRLIVIVKENQ